MFSTIWAQHHLEWGKRTYVMGIINVTPDSFSGDGLAVLREEEMVQKAVEQARRFVAEGVTFLDVGGESSRPQATPISEEEELVRVLPVIRALRATLPREMIISVDTY